METFDYVVVGAGSAGCVVASRLSEDPEVRVLLIEAGGTDDHADVADPTRWPALLQGPLDWGYRTAPMRHANNRVDHCPRARMLGGCHSHNASAWVRGHPADYDHWAYQGNTGWDWQSVLPVFKRIEDWQGPASDLRGVGGPMHVAPPTEVGLLAAACREAGGEVGLRVIEDLNGPCMEGIGYFNLTIKDGRRFSVASAYLRPALGRPNLTLVMDADVQHLSFDGSTCTGVEYLAGGAGSRARASREVIVCAGAIGSPRLLLLSGVGPAADLRRLGLPVIADLPGVGLNLQDHTLVGGVAYEAIGELPPLVNNGAETTWWWKSSASMLVPDTQPVLIEFPFATAALADRLTPNAYTLAPSVVRPGSRGSVTLASTDPAVHPRIDINFLESRADVDALVAAVELCREVGAARAFDKLRRRELMPGNLGRAAMEDFVRNGATTYFHPAGSCKMGPDALAVVDGTLRVHGVQGLRVADASIMPTITSGNTNAPSIMIGERAVDLIRAHA
ncbi:MAG: GMC family oxidoreductase N-terminal domain-containing protein [Acidobacteriota bacterium]|nr:GMC family oxidoreductase N-terminal domain-containing protein [Acidobacteriota bacterium]